MTLDTLLRELRQRNVTLWLEGDRLRYRAAKDALSAALLEQMKAHKAEIIDFLHQATASSSQLPAIVPIDRNQELPLSFAQQRFWFLHQFEPDSSSNNMPVVVRFTGSLEIAVLERSIAEVVRRHEVLRTTFPAVNGQPTQKIAPPAPVALPLIDLRHLPEAEREGEAFRLATAEAHCGFDLANGPILRVMLICLNDREHLLIWNMHCMICDGASSDVFYQDLTAIYTAFAAGKPSPLEDLPIQYVDFAHWQRQWLQGEVLETQLNYWKKKLEGDVPRLQLPYAHPHPLTIRTYKGDRGARMLPVALNEALINLSQRLGTTLFMTLLAAFQVLLYRYSKQDDILISFASAGRGQVETERLLGFFSNTLLLRTCFTGDPTFKELLSQVREKSLEAYAHQDLPFEKLVEELRPEKHQNPLPLFQVKFALNPPWSKGRGMASVYLPDLTITSLFGYIYHGETKYDLILVMREQDEGLGMVFDYNAEIFDASTIARMLGHFQTLLEGIVADPDQRISDLPLLTEPEQQMLKTWSGVTADSSSDSSVPQIFEAQVSQSPTAPALSCQEQMLTYQDLNARANQLAHYLQKQAVQPGDRVLVKTGLCLEMIVSMLAVLKVGASYLLLEPEQLLVEVEPLLEKVGVSCLLTLSSLAEQATAKPLSVIYLDTIAHELDQHSSENPQFNGSGDQVAAITVGADLTDGQWLTVSHQGMIQATRLIDISQLGCGDRLLHWAPASSGMAVYEIWSCLLNGACLVLPAVPPVSVEALGQAIDRYQITALRLTTRQFNRLVDQRLTMLQSVRQLLLQGEVASTIHVQQLLQQYQTCQLISIYSPAAQFPIVACYPITTAEQPLPQTAIGRPVGSTQIYLLDSHLQPVPLGIPGQVYLNVAGWVPNCLPNARRGSGQWVEHPLAQEPGAYRYQTGDLASYLPDGTLDRVGQVDQPIKIRDVSVSPHKVETVLEQHPGVQEALIVARKDADGRDQLIGYAVFDPTYPETNSATLLSFLRQQLPAYMTPTAIIPLQELPLTPAGCIDYALLPALDSGQLDQGAEASLVTSRNDLELQLTQIWEEVLGIQPIGVQDNFFDLGGHSLLAVRLFARIEEVLGQQLVLSTLLQAPTIEQQAELIRSQGFSTPKEWLVPLRQGSNNLPPLFCIYGIFLYYDLAQQLGTGQAVYGLYLQEEVDLLRTEGTTHQPATALDVPQVAALYLKKIRSIQPSGPYYLAGESFGGVMAYEIAQQLQAQGEKVALLAFLDTKAPGTTLKMPWQKRVVQHVHELRRKGPNYILQRLNRKLQPSQSAAIANGAEEELRLQFRRQIARGYTLQPYSGKITLLRAMERESQFESIEMDPLFGWDKVALEGVEAYDVPGDHVGILKAPNVRVLARVLTDCIHAVSVKG